MAKEKGHKEKLIDEIQMLAQSKGVNTVFTTFLEITANSIAAQMDPEHAEIREARYGEIASGMTPETLEAYARMFGQLCLAVLERQDDPCDILGDIYHKLRLNNEWSGQFFTPDHKLVLSEKRDEPRMIDGGMTWTFFDWSGSEKLKAKGILSTEWLDLTAKARYVSFGGKQARMPLVVSNRGYGIAAAASRTALLCNVRTFGTYLHTAGDGQIDYYFILGKDRDEIIKQYKEL